MVRAMSEPRTRTIEANGLSFQIDETGEGEAIGSGGMTGKADGSEDQFERMRPGSPFVQFSYGADPPLPQIDGVEVRRAAIVWHNIPPMHVWVYRAAAPA